MSSNQLVLTVAETAEALALSPRTIARMLARHDLPSIKIGRRRLIRRDALRTWLDSRGDA